jgi:hypothetical protein
VAPAVLPITEAVAVLALVELVAVEQLLFWAQVQMELQMLAVVVVVVE